MAQDLENSTDTGSTDNLSREMDVGVSESAVLNIIALLLENYRAILVIPIVVAVLAFGISFLITPSFTATVRFLPPQQQQSITASMLQSIGAIGLGGAAGALKNPADQYIAMLRTNNVENKLIDRFELLKRYDEKYKQDARLALEKKTRISSGKDGLINIDFEDSDANISAQIANAYVEEFRQLLSTLAVTEAQQRRVFFGKQVTLAKNALILAEQSLAGSGVSLGSLNSNPSTALEGTARLRAQVTAQEVRIAAMRSYLTGSAPEIRNAQAELSAIRSELDKAERIQPQSQGSNDYIAKFREFKYQEALFDLFSRQFELARIDESREGALVQVVDIATPPEKKSKPQKSLIALGAFFTSFAFILGALLLRSRISKLKPDSPARAQMNRISLAWKGIVK
jgi:uncharacterized protein involved in exopolysaccharide biosynthesis